MINDATTLNWLNLVYSSPDFVIRMGESHESSHILSPDMIPANDGEYWVAGETVLANGMKLPSVFAVDTNTGGRLVDVYWKIDDQWWDSQKRPGIFAALGAQQADIFPFDWTYHVLLQEDIYHA